MVLTSLHILRWVPFEFSLGIFFNSLSFYYYHVLLIHDERLVDSLPSCIGFPTGYYLSSHRFNILEITCRVRPPRYHPSI